MRKTAVIIGILGQDGANSKAKNVLGWESKVNFEKISQNNDGC